MAIRPLRPEGLRVHRPFAREIAISIPLMAGLLHRLAQTLGTGERERRDLSPGSASSRRDVATSQGRRDQSIPRFGWSST